MKRTPEPELMDEVHQAKAYSEADFATPHEAFCDESLRVFENLADGIILDLGCGPADVTVRFAQRFPTIEMVGIDGADAMLELGRKRIEQCRLDKRIKLINCYLPSSKLKSDFDGVISNSLLHHLADPLVLWQTIAKCARIGAPVFVMDLMRPNSPRAVSALVEMYAAGEPPILQHDFQCSLHAAYRPIEIRKQLELSGLGHLSVEVISDRHLIVFGHR